MIETSKLVKYVVGHSTRRELVHTLDARRVVGNAIDKETNRLQNYPWYEVVGEGPVEKQQAKSRSMQNLPTRYHLYNKEEA